MSASPSFQKLCAIQGKAISALLNTYEILKTDDEKLALAEALTIPCSLRNSTTRENLANELARLRVHRTHYLVADGEVGQVSIWVVRPDFDPSLAGRQNPPSDVDVAFADPLGEILRNFDHLLRRFLSETPGLSEALMKKTKTSLMPRPRSDRR